MAPNLWNWKLKNYKSQFSNWCAKCEICSYCLAWWAFREDSSNAVLSSSSVFISEMCARLHIVFKYSTSDSNRTVRYEKTKFFPIDNRIRYENFQAIENQSMTEHWCRPTSFSSYSHFFLSLSRSLSRFIFLSKTEIPSVNLNRCL